LAQTDLPALEKVCRIELDAERPLCLPIATALHALSTTQPVKARSTLLDAVADVIGSVDRLPHDLSARKKKYLRSTGYGDKRSG
jgi:hypothetical protein